MQAGAEAGKRPGGWTNWAGNQTARPEKIVDPTNVDDLRRLVRTSAGPLRVAGSGHSFTPVAVTDGTLIRLDGMGLVHSINKENKRAWVNAGARFKYLAPALERHGLAFRNLGDDSAASLAGAISTATHGTGAGLPCLSADITGLKIMTADGTILTVSKDQDREIFEAARVSIGVLGVLVEAEIQLVDSFCLHRRTWTEPLDALIGHSPSRWEALRHFEFSYIPFSGHGLCVSHEETKAAPTKLPSGHDGEALLALKRARDYAGDDHESRMDMLKETLEAFETADVIGNSWQLFARERSLRSIEMEYHLPERKALSVFREIVQLVEQKHPDVFLPINVRRTRGDNMLISPFNGGSRVSIAMHAYHEDDCDFLFSEIEPIFLKAGGRPHWGKVHSLKSRTLQDIYPDFVTFCGIRNRLDPDGRFLTPYLREIFGVKRGL